MIGVNVHATNNWIPNNCDVGNFLIIKCFKNAKMCEYFMYVLLLCLIKLDTYKRPKKCNPKNDSTARFLVLQWCKSKTQALFGDEI